MDIIIVILYDHNVANIKKNKNQSTLWGKKKRKNPNSFSSKTWRDSEIYGKGALSVHCQEALPLASEEVSVGSECLQELWLNLSR